MATPFGDVERDFLRMRPADRITVLRARGGARASAVERLRIAVMLGRPRTCVVGFLTYALGTSYGGRPISAVTVTEAILCFLGGFVANLENTYTDLEEDCHNLPGRTYLVFRLGLETLRRLVVGLNVAMLGAAAVLGPRQLVLMTLALLIVHQYSFGPLRAKARPLIGLVVFAQVVAFPFLVGAGELASQRVLGMFGFLLVWFIAKGTFKNVPDYDGDRAAGLRTSATLFASRARAAAFSWALTTLAYGSLAILVLPAGGEPPRVLLALAWLAPVQWNCERLLRARDAREANRCLTIDMPVSIGFITTLVLLVSPRSPSVVAVVVGFLIIVASDWLGVDSRRTGDTQAAS